MDLELVPSDGKSALKISFAPKKRKENKIVDRSLAQLDQHGKTLYSMLTKEIEKCDSNQNIVDAILFYYVLNEGNDNIRNSLWILPNLDSRKKILTRLAVELVKNDFMTYTRTGVYGNSTIEACRILRRK